MPASSALPASTRICAARGRRRRGGRGSVRRAAAMLGNPVVVEDDAGRPLAGWGADGRPHRLGPGGLATAPAGVAVAVTPHGATGARSGSGGGRGAAGRRPGERAGGHGGGPRHRQVRPRAADRGRAHRHVRARPRARAGRGQRGVRGPRPRLGVECRRDPRAAASRRRLRPAGDVRSTGSAAGCQSGRWGGRRRGQIVAVCSAGDEDVVAGESRPPATELTGPRREPARRPPSRRGGESRTARERSGRFGSGAARVASTGTPTSTVYDALLADDPERAARVGAPRSTASPTTCGRRSRCSGAQPQRGPDGTRAVRPPQHGPAPGCAGSRPHAAST